MNPTHFLLLLLQPLGMPLLHMLTPEILALEQLGTIWYLAAEF